MATTKNLGRIGFVLQGEYSGSKTYQRLDCVSKDGKTYSAIKDVPAGIPITNEEYWQILVDAADKLDRYVFHQIHMEGKSGYINYKTGAITSSAKSLYYELDCSGIVQIEYYPGVYTDTGGYAFYNEDGFIAGSSKKTTDNSKKVSLTIPEGATIFRCSFYPDQPNVGLWVKKSWFEDALDRIDVLEPDVAELIDNMPLALGVEKSLQIAWTQGGLRPSDDGAAQSSLIRIRTNFIEQRGNKRIIVKPNGQAFYWLQYVSNETAGYTHVNSGWLTKEAILPEGDYYYRIMAANSDTLGNILPEDAKVEICFLSQLNIGINQLRTDVNTLKITERKQNYRLDNLESATQGNTYRVETNSETTHIKDVPDDAMPWATLDKVGAKTIVWNQLQPNDTSRTNKGVDYVYENGRLDVSGIATANSYWLGTGSVDPLYIHFEQGHKYIVVLGNSDYSYNGTGHCGVYIPFATRVNIQSDYYVFNSPDTSTHYLQFTVTSENEVHQTYYPQIFDLTLMFGAGNEPDAETFRTMFPDNYYPYSEPIIKSFDIDKIISYSRNLFCCERLRGKTVASDGLRITFDNNGSGIVVDGTATGNVRIPVFGDGSLDGSRFPYESGIYTFKTYYDTTLTSGTIFVYVDNSGKPSVAGGSQAGTRQCDKGVAYCYMRFSKGDSFNNVRVNFGLYEGNVAMPYTPYRDTTTTDLTSFKTKYFPDDMHSMNTLIDEINLERGVTVQRVGVQNVSALTITETSQENVFYFSGVTGHRTSSDCGVMLAGYTTVEKSNDVASFAEVGDMIVGNMQGDAYIYIKDTSCSTKEDLAEKLVGKIILYELGAPIEKTIEAEDFASIHSIGIDGGGKITFLHEDGAAIGVPNEVSYLIKLNAYDIADRVSVTNDGAGNVTLSVG